MNLSADDDCTTNVWHDSRILIQEESTQIEMNEEKYCCRNIEASETVENEEQLFLVTISLFDCCTSFASSVWL